MVSDSWRAGSDLKNERIVKRAGMTQKLSQMKYLYDGDQTIAEYDGNNSLLHKYIYGPGVDQPICMIDAEHSNAAYYYHFDGLGSVIALTNSAGSVVNLYEYSVYGEVSASDPNHPNRFLFTGREFDADTGLYYYRARYYNPYSGRFLQMDPAGQGMNAYAYCGNNPVCALDPSGAFFDWCGFRRENDQLEFWWINNDNKEQTYRCASVDAWIKWAYEDKEKIWSTLKSGDGLWMQQAVGWKMAGWAGAIDDKGTMDRKWWFWRLRALMMLGLDDTAIEAMENAGWNVKLRYGEGRLLGYYYYGHTVVWDPRRTQIFTGKTGWFHFHPLVSLAHELGHAIHQWQGVHQHPSPQAEVDGIGVENFVRDFLHRCDPTQWNLYPRRGYLRTVPDFGAVLLDPSHPTEGYTVPTADEAWAAYDPAFVSFD